MPSRTPIAINNVLTVCVYIIIYILIAIIYFFPYISVYPWKNVQSPLYSALAIFIIADTLHVSVPVYSVIHSLPFVIIRHIVYSL